MRHWEQAQKAMRRSMTPAEKRLWAALRPNRLDGLHFRRQQIIDGFIVDFYCHAAALAVEVDGPVHDGQVEYDADRDRILQARGLHALRIRNEEVMQDRQGVLARIRAICHSRLPSPEGEGRGVGGGVAARGGAGGEVPERGGAGARAANAQALLDATPIRPAHG